MKYLLLSILFMSTAAFENQASVVQQFAANDIKPLALQADASVAAIDQKMAISPYGYYTSRLDDTREILNKVIESVLRERLANKTKAEKSLWNKIYRAVLPEFNSLTLSAYAYYSTNEMIITIRSILDTKVALMKKLLAATSAGIAVGEPNPSIPKNKNYKLYEKYAQLARDYRKEEIEGLEEIPGSDRINEWNMLITAKVVGMPIKTLKRYERESKKGDEISLTYEIDNFVAQEALLPATERELSFLI